MSQPGTFGQPRPGLRNEVKEIMKRQLEMFGTKEMIETSSHIGSGHWWIERPAEDPYEHVLVEPTLDYKFNEDEIIDELQKYIDSTYEGHYSKNKFQSMEFIVDCGHGDSFCLGNVIKYAQRYGKKDGKNRKDLLKIMHYAIIALSVLDDELNGENDNEDM